MTDRRDFLKLTTSAALSGAFAPNLPAAQPATAQAGFKGQVVFFSKHLPQTNFELLARTVKTLGFDGVDLTVRPGGHVLPDRAAEDLPKAATAIRAAGLSLPMITTGLLSVADPTAKPILSTAGKLGIPFIKPGYWKYQFTEVRRELAKFAEDFRGLVELAKQSGVQFGFHNHEGYLGGPLLDVVNTIDALDAKSAGYYFDVRHAVVEGGGAGWKIAFNLIAPRLKMIAVKDFYWDKTSKGWKIINCPLGEGMVDWKAYFKLLRQANFAGPISVHFEYEIGGATNAAVEENTLAAAQRDLAFVQARLKEAFV